MELKPKSVVGQHIDQFKLEQYLAKGSMGLVFKALDTVLLRTVALKLIPKLTKQGLSVEELSAREEARKRLIQEAKAAGRLAHPNIVTIYSYGETDEFEYICMEYVDGKTLSQIIREGNVISIEESVPIVEQILLALVAANEEHIVHRDIKPSNVMMTNDKRVKVMDFGIAKLPSLSLTLTGVVLGTPYYMSPEQISGQKVDIRSDLFSVGALFYEMVTGIRPFEAESTATLVYKIVQVDPVPPRVLNLHVPETVGNIISHALAKDPGLRYQTPVEMLNDLQALRHALISEEINTTADATVIAWGLDYEQTIQFGKPTVEEVEGETHSVQLPPVLERAPTDQPMTFTPTPLEISSSSGKNDTGEQGDPAVVQPPPDSPKTEQSDREPPKVQLEKEKVLEEKLPARPSAHPSPEAKKQEAAANAMTVKKTASSRAILIVLVLVLATISGIFFLFWGMSRSPQDMKQTPSVVQNAADSPAQQQSATQPPSIPDSSQIAMKVNSLIAEAQGLWQTNPGGAQKALEEAVSLDPNSFVASYQLARFLTQKKDFPAAIQQYQKALYLNNQVHEVYFNLGYIYLTQGDYQSAMDNYQSCRRLYPPYLDEVLTNMGIIELKRKNLTEARLLFQQALEFNPKNSPARNYLNKMGNPPDNR
jgi:eukaryotic-like serine/threonine-protein kinase